MTLEFNHFPQIVDQLHKGLSQAVGDTAKKIAEIYQANAPRESGFMADSAYAVTSTESTYGQGSVSPPKGAYLLPEVEGPSDDLTAYAAVAANYAGYPEFGTRFQLAQPTFYPAVEEAGSFLDDQLSQVAKSLGMSI